MAFPLLGSSDHVVVSVSIDFPVNSKWDGLSHGIDYDYSCIDQYGICDHFRDVPWEDIFKLSASAATSEFCEWVQVVLPQFIEITLFIFIYQQNKPSESKGKFRQPSNFCKWILEAAKLAYATKAKASITSQKFRSWEIWQIAKSLCNNGKSAIYTFSIQWTTEVVFCI